MEQLDPFWFVTIVTLLSGAGGTGIGGLIGALFRTDSNRTISLLLAFAGGVMSAMVCFDLIAEAVEAAEFATDWGVWLVIGAVALGVAVVYGLNFVIDRHTKDEVPHSSAEEHPQTHDDIDELIHADHWAEHRRSGQSRAGLVIAGIVMAAAIALHNIPEGMTIGASFAISDDLFLGTGMTMAVLIGLHNVPEGMAVSVPLIGGGMGRVKAVLITATCGIPTLIGAWLGLWMGDVGPMGLAVSLGFASGAMLYVVYGEIIPEAFLMYRSKLPAFAIIAGILLGMAMIF